MSLSPALAAVRSASAVRGRGLSRLSLAVSTTSLAVYYVTATVVPFAMLLAMELAVLTLASGSTAPGEAILRQVGSTSSGIGLAFAVAAIGAAIWARSLAKRGAVAEPDRSVPWVAVIALVVNAVSGLGLLLLFVLSNLP
ncbi:hypothetical protein ET445_10175 [Agromyces protaetiae]|uniref:Uncharacterized protein n=1 Tax=Agromyces protaetiae TaxID=2509455 RepID=A0A4P6FC91_9MICO|nr:hypothetical protein [Agromyces protaetiae]QAY73652.1 hypothetical protein ET445_10175 [Agromyces protaetiae]